MSEEAKKPEQVGGTGNAGREQLPHEMAAEARAVYYEGKWVESEKMRVMEAENRRYADDERTRNLERETIPSILGYTIMSNTDHINMEMSAETTKIRKHTHDTLWAVLAGFAASSGLMVIMAGIVLAILSFARGL